MPTPFENLEPTTVVHRVGGGGVANLRISPLDEKESPPGISVLLGGTPREAAEQMRRAFPKSRKWQTGSGLVGSATVGELRRAGFDILPDPTARFPNHARIIHAEGVNGFSDENLATLSQAFQETSGC